MTEKDAALQRLYKRLYEAIDELEPERLGEFSFGYNSAITDVIEILDASSDETWYEEEL